MLRNKHLSAMQKNSNNDNSLGNYYLIIVINIIVDISLIIFIITNIIAIIILISITIIVITIINMILITIISTMAQ